MRKQEGFTLLEVLVALSILGMIMATAFNALRLGSRSWESGLLRAQESSELRSVPTFISRQLSQMVPLSWEEGRDFAVAFEGKSNLVQFIAPAPQRQASNGMFEYALKFEQGKKGVNLKVYYQPYQPGFQKFRISGESPASILLEGVKNASFSYYGATRKGTPPTWLRDWTSRTGNFPTLIRLNIEIDEAARPWPELIVPLRARPKGV